MLWNVLVAPLNRAFAENFESEIKKENPLVLLHYQTLHIHTHTKDLKPPITLTGKVVFT